MLKWNNPKSLRERKREKTTSHTWLSKKDNGWSRSLVSKAVKKIQSTERKKINLEFVLKHIKKQLNFKMGKTPGYFTQENIERASKHMKKSSTSYINRKVQIKTDITVPWLEWPKCSTLTRPNAGEEVEQQGLWFIASGNAKWLNVFLPYYPATILLGICHNELKT